MFLPHFGLQEAPFGIVTDPKFLYFGLEHREAIASLYLNVVEGRAVGALVGEPGMGKSTLLDHLLRRLADRAQTVWLSYPFRTRQDLVRAVLRGLDLDSTADGDFQQWTRLQSHLSELWHAGRVVVLVFDEAQALSVEALEQVRHLSNLRTAEVPSPEIILSGHLSLLQTLDQPELEALRQRIGTLARMATLEPEAVKAYIEHRVAAAGREEPLFDDDAVAVVARESAGVPRRINQLCVGALALAYADDQPRVAARHVEQSAADLLWQESQAARSARISRFSLKWDLIPVEEGEPALASDTALTGDQLRRLKELAHDHADPAGPDAPASDPGGESREAEAVGVKPLGPAASNTPEVETEGAPAGSHVRAG